MKSGLRCVTGSSSAAQPASPPSTTGSSSAAQPASPHVDTRDAAAGSAEQPAGQNVLKNLRGVHWRDTIEISSDEERKCGIPGLPDNYTSGDDSDESVNTCLKRRKHEEIKEGKERRAARKAKLQEAASSRSTRANAMDRPRDFANLQVGDRLEGTRLTRMWSQRAPNASSELLLRGGELEGAEFAVAEVDRQEDYTQVKTEVASMQGWVSIWSRRNKAGWPTGVRFVSAGRPVK